MKSFLIEQNLIRDAVNSFNFEFRAIKEKPEFMASLEKVSNCLSEKVLSLEKGPALTSENILHMWVQFSTAKHLPEEATRERLERLQTQLQ